MIKYNLEVIESGYGVEPGTKVELLAFLPGDEVMVVTEDEQILHLPARAVSSHRAGEIAWWDPDCPWP